MVNLPTSFLFARANAHTQHLLLGLIFFSFLYSPLFPTYPLPEGVGGGEQFKNILYPTKHTHTCTQIYKLLCSYSFLYLFRVRINTPLQRAADRGCLLVGQNSLMLSVVRWVYSSTQTMSRAHTFTSA